METCHIGFFRLQLTVRRQPQCGVYLLLFLLSVIICRFGECQPPANDRTARLLAR